MIRQVIKSLATCALLSAQLVALAEIPEERLSAPFASVFGAPPTIGDPMLSPDGSRLLFMQQNPQGVSMLLGLDLTDGELVPVLQGREDGYDIRWCKIAAEERVFCFVRNGMPEAGPSSQRFIAVNIDGSQLESMPDLLTCFRYDYLRNQPPIDWVPDNPSQVLFHCGVSSTMSPPELINTFTGRSMNVGGGGNVGESVRLQYFGEISTPFYSFYRSGPGDLGRGQSFHSNGHGLIDIYRGRQSNLDHWFFRPDVETEWQEFLTVDPLAFDPPFRPVGYGERLDRVFNIGWDEANETWGLYRQQLSGDFANERVFSHGAVDVELVDTMGRYQRVVSAAFLDGRPQRAIVDPRVAEVYETLAAQLPEFDIEIVDESWDRNRYLARARPPNGAGELLLVDMAAASVQPIGPEYDHLTGVELAGTTLVQFEGTDGAPVTGHLTLPRDIDGPVPAVILPRSRPSHEDIADPHYLVQFLAASGYAVLRVQNRVEAEYGRGWTEERAIAGWAQSAADIRAGADFLVDSGVTRAGTICAAGKDYGAYTAFMAAIEYPELLRCVVSIAAVTDPRELPGGELVNALPDGGSRRLTEASPIRRAEAIEAAVLMFHGSHDVEFRALDHTLILGTVLERADKDVTVIEYPQAMHRIQREPDRVDMLTRMRGFLAEHIGPGLTEEETASGAGRWRLVQ